MQLHNTNYFIYIPLLFIIFFLSELVHVYRSMVLICPLEDSAVNVPRRSVGLCGEIEAVPSFSH